MSVHAISRESFLLRGALAAGAAYGTAAVGPFVARSIAQRGTNDLDIAKFALRLEQLEAAFYADALRRGSGLSAEVRSVARELRESEDEHVDFLTALVKQLAGSPEKRPEPRFGGAFASEAEFLRVAQTLEETGVSAYNGVVPGISSADILQLAGGIAQVEARHAAVIRLLRDEDVAPSAFDRALGPREVLARLRPFGG